MNHFSEDFLQRVQDSSNLIDVVEDFVQLELKGRSEKIGQCLNCLDPKGLHIPTAKTKQLFKCVKCGDGGKFPLQYLQSQVKKSFAEAVRYLADKYNITEDLKVKVAKRKKKKTEKSFRDIQLMESGLIDDKGNGLEMLKFSIFNGGAEYPDNYRYQKGSINHFNEVDSSGDDMILNYLNLDGSLTCYLDGKVKKFFKRVRFKFPKSNTDSFGKPMKYKSPKGSGSHLWFPNFVIEQAKIKGSKFETLVIVEGEKKADKLCKHGILCVGISGIHNFEFDKMPKEFEQLISTFDILNVVFLLDEDWQDMTLKPDKSIDLRPRSFYKAVLNFKNYFYSFLRGGLNLKIFFGSHLSNRKFKGVDDLLTGHKGLENKVIEDFEQSIISLKKEGKYFKLFDITSTNDYNLQSYWNLDSVPKFLEKNKSKLIELKEFKFGKFKYIYNKLDDKFELNQKLLPHEKYWTTTRDDLGKVKKISFDFLNVEDFMKNRGIGTYFQDSRLDPQLIHIDGKMIRKIDPRYIQQFIIDFSRTLEVDEWRLVYNMLKRGVVQYLGKIQCDLLPTLSPSLLEPSIDSQRFIFDNCYVTVDQENITVSKETSFNYWQDEVIKRSFEKLDPLFGLKREGKVWKLDVSKDSSKSEIFTFILNTSCVFWRKTYELIDNGDGTYQYKLKRNSDGKPFSNKTNGVTEDEVNETLEIFASKVLAIGYLLHNYVDKSNMKAIVCMDLKESERGSSEGGTGKSIFSMMLEHLVPIFDVDATSNDLANNQFIFEGVDEQTKIIVLDDVRSDFDFKVLFSKITNGLIVQRKGQTRINAGNKKFILNLNGVLRGDSYSYLRRQYPIGFTDYYNQYRTPADEFGHQLFDGWDKEQWNLYFNFCFNCLQVYLKYGLKFTSPDEKIQKRRQRAFMGETFLEWAEHRFLDNGLFLNRTINKRLILSDFKDLFPNQTRQGDVKKLKEKIKVFCQYSGLDFNIEKNGDRIKSGSDEYVCVSNDDYTSEFGMVKYNHMGDFDLNTQRFK